jgi:hypothetical protein
MAVDQLGKGAPDGTIMGISATDKLGFYGLATAIVQPVTVAAGTDAATTQVCANACRTTLRALGLMA